MKSVICDIDGVLLADNRMIPGAEIFIRRLLDTNTRFVLLTNYPSQTPADLRGRIAVAGLEVSPDVFYTSAMATAAFLERQEGRTAFVIGEGALTHELYRIGFTITETAPDFVIVGETRAYNWDMIQKASRLILEGARFIATNPDVAGPKGHPACGALCAPIERITGKAPYYIGKPNPWIMRAALAKLGAHSEDTIMVGDNMATDILAGLQAGMDTILVLTGVSTEANLSLFPYRPTRVVASAAEIPWPLS
jgi:NagD protein